MTKSLQAQLNSLPKTAGIYKFLDDKKIVLYVGKAKNLRARVGSYFKQNAEISLAKQDMLFRIKDIQTIPATTEEEALILEAMNIKKYKPPYNVVLKDDKDYSFVKIDMKQEYPTVTIVRRPALEEAGRPNSKSKFKLYGPFTSAYALQENLRFLRRIFPFRKRVKALTKFEKDLLEKRSIGAVPASRVEYLDMIKRLMKIIEGHTSAVQRDLKKKMHAFSKAKQYEQAASVRNQIQWLDIFSNRQKIVSAKEYLERTMPRVDTTNNALADIQRALKLKNIPHRIEGYDISNIQGEFSVGSMVVFTDAKPDKSEYRKFKIKSVSGADDFASLAEVLQRRFRHHGWNQPNLVLLDGGKGQLSAVLNLSPFTKGKTRSHLSPFTKGEIKRGLLRSSMDIHPNQFIAIAKKKEQIFQGKNAHLINLSPSSPASQLLQRVRDEAHRFAQKYYHTLHSKSYDKNKIRKTRTKKAQSAQNES